MKDPWDDRIRSALHPLREAPVPAPPNVRPAPERPRPALGLAAAAAMLSVLAGSLFLFPRRAPDPGALAGRIQALEARIATVEHEEIRALLGRELGLLRRELELSRAPGP